LRLARQHAQVSDPRSDRRKPADLDVDNRAIGDIARLEISPRAAEVFLVESLVVLIQQDN
jgi:hypothetical protein